MIQIRKAQLIIFIKFYRISLNGIALPVPKKNRFISIYIFGDYDLKNKIGVKWTFCVNFMIETKNNLWKTFVSIFTFWGVAVISHETQTVSF